MRKIISILLIISMILLVLTPITGMKIHKMVSCLFLILSFIHIILNKKRMSVSKWILITFLLFCFITGILGFINGGYFNIIHRAISIIFLIISAIHLYVFRKRLFY